MKATTPSGAADLPEALRSIQRFEVVDCIDDKVSLGRRAEGMDGNEWDQWVQEKFAQVNGLRVQGGNYAWYWG